MLTRRLIPIGFRESLTWSKLFEVLADFSKKISMAIYHINLIFCGSHAILILYRSSHFQQMLNNFVDYVVPNFQGLSPIKIGLKLWGGQNVA